MALKLKTKHFLTGEELSREELTELLTLAETVRTERKAGKTRTELAGKNVSLVFEKPSLRTRMSFTVALFELGAHAIELVSSFRKKESPEDTALVIAQYSHGIMVRTFEHENLDRMSKNCPVPIINGLSDSHHPCQVLADLQTLQQSFGKLAGLKLAYVGDGNNMLNSILLLMPYLGVHVTYACPKGFEPNAFIVKKAKARAKEGGGSITAVANPKSAVEGADAIYTDVWASMGQEDEELEREKIFKDYQVNETLYAASGKPNAIVMHCMPMVRGKEITESMADHPNSVIYRQAENRMHAQKALLLGLLAR
ncbi:MAG: ornithine carbamoyltransferase [Bdellovibrionales bacterium]|nr:ornithine carbamoyltransferase [Bdellovibrionales bacterium]